VKSVCTLCSKGCNTNLGYHPRRNEVLRVTARENMDVNQWWICDRGRGQYAQFHAPDRLTAVSRRRDGAVQAVAWTEAIPVIATAIKGVVARHGAEAVGVIASAELTNEECFLTRRVFRDGLGLANVDFPARPQPPVVYPKFTIEGDRNPNSKGARATGVGPGTGGRSVADMMRAAADGSIRALVFLRGGPLDQFGDPAVTARALDRAELIIVVDSIPSPVSAKAHWTLPGVSSAEKEGTFTNSAGRVQRVRKAFRRYGDAREEWRILQDLGRALGALSESDPDPERIFDRLARAVPAFAGLSYAALGDQGAPLAAASANVVVG